MLNYKAVLQDYLNTFDKHIDNDAEHENRLRTKKFYRIDEWDPKRYFSLLNKYETHNELVNDLFFELTRAANFVCDKVRETIFRGYRLQEGVLLVERHSVGFEMSTVLVRAEYRGDERTEIPYPGLKKFKEIRYTTRDYALDPDPVKLPELDDDDV